MIEGGSGDILDRWRWTEGNRRRSRPKIDGGSGDVLDRDSSIRLGHTHGHGGHPVAGPGVGEVVAGRQCLTVELVSGHGRVTSDDNVMDQLLYVVMHSYGFCTPVTQRQVLIKINFQAPKTIQTNY